MFRCFHATQYGDNPECHEVFRMNLLEQYSCLLYYTGHSEICAEGILKTVPGYHTTLTCMVDCTHLVIVTCTHPCDHTLHSPLWFYLVLTFVVVPCTHPCGCTLYSPLWLYLVLTPVIVSCTHYCDCTLYSPLWLYLVLTLVIVSCTHYCDCTL